MRKTPWSCSESGWIYHFTGSWNTGVWTVGGIFGGAFGNCRSLADSKIGIVKNYYAEERWKKSTAAGMKKQEDNR